MIDVLVTLTNMYAKKKGASGRREGEKLAGVTLALGLWHP